MEATAGHGSGDQRFAELAGREWNEGLLPSVEGATALQPEVPEPSVAPVLSTGPTWVHPLVGTLRRGSHLWRWDALLGSRVRAERGVLG